MRKIKINDQAIFQLKQAFLKIKLEKNRLRSAVSAGAHHDQWFACGAAA